VRVRVAREAINSPAGPIFGPENRPLDAEHALPQRDAGSFSGRHPRGLMDCAATFVGQQEIHRANDIEAVGAVPTTEIVAKVRRHRSGAMHGVLSVLLEYQLRNMPSVLVVIHGSRRPEPFPVAVLGALDQIGEFRHVTRVTKYADVRTNGD
jgi:hypothetical protein